MTQALFLLFCHRYKNGIPVGNTSRSRISQNEDVCTLTLSDLYDSDKGQIQCEIRNALGTESCDCHLDIQCKYEGGMGKGMLGIGLCTCIE